MEPETISPIAQGDPADAFTTLRGEVSLLRRAVEGLTAERQNAPDYTPTLTDLSRRLAHIEGFLNNVAESPAMRLTPENLAVSIARASETVRAGDRETLGQLGATLQASIATINGIVKHARTADHQWIQLCWAGGGGLLMGIMCALFVTHLIG